MSELYGDQYESAGAFGGRLFPERLRRLAGAVLFISLIAAMGLWAYRLGTRDAAAIPIIRALEGPARVQPEDPGGLRAAHQGLEVNAVLAGQPAPAPTTAAPLAPVPALVTEEDGPQGELVVAGPARLTEPDQAAQGELRMPMQDEGPDGMVALETAPAEAEAPPAPPELDIAALIEAELAGRAETQALPGAGPRSRPANLVVARAAAPAPSAALAAALPAAAPAAREVANLNAGARLIQLGAFDSEALTRQAWGRLTSRHGDLLGAKSLYVERTTANARVFYRLRVAGFEGTDQTRAMCEALRARGVDCIPVTLQ